MTDIKQLAEVCDLVQTESESQTATLAERVLTPEAQAERDDFQAEYGYDGNCSCHISPPCNSCLHPGNPRNQEEDETAWVADGAIDWTAPEMQYLAPKDYDLPPADPALLASANRILSDRLEGVAHVLRGCGLPALADISGAEDLQMAAAALSGSYQMALADAAAVPDLRNITAELEATVALQRETLVTAAADVSRLSAELATERRVSGSAISAVARICEHLGCDDHNGHVPVLRAIDDLRAQIASLTADVMRTRGSLNSAINEADRLRAELAVERQACKTLQESASTAPVRAATSFIVRAAKQKPRTFSSIEKAREAAMAAIRAGAQRAEVCPMLPPVGVARKGAGWRAA
jgi:hypothetical protein